MKHLRKCIVCGKEYDYCPSCSQYKNLETWKNIYCSENCMKINQVSRLYKAGNTSKTTLKNILKKLDLSNRDCFRLDIKTMIKDVNVFANKKK